MDDRAAVLLAKLDEAGVLLEHDKYLPSATATIAGKPIVGSWWSHPLANPIYNALEELDQARRMLRVKLVAGKVTLVARRLWPDLFAVVTERAEWQTDGLSDKAIALLADIDAAPTPLVLDHPTKSPGTELEAALLVHATSVHLPTGNHAKALQPWEPVAATYGIDPAPDPAASREVFEVIVRTWDTRRRLLPWPAEPAEGGG
jgi:hypothetical protein